jgi:putative ATPase
MPPLAEILRPKHLDEYLGQKHLVGDKAVLRKSIDSGNIPSMILWGPPGVGKTTLAYLIAQQLGRKFYILSAISSGVKEVRAVIDQAGEDGGSAILFIDEIHRFSKSQQDSLLGAVEKGIVTLIGATTENPSFEVISPLLSRCQVYILKNLDVAELTQLMDTARQYYAQHQNRDIHFDEQSALLRLSGGDARKLLNAIELVVQAENSNPLHITDTMVLDLIQQNLVLYDKSGEMHYDIISAFIKSIRGSDPNAAVYYLARMLEAGEDPKFIARRLVILASEDIGHANPNALLLATTGFQSVNLIGMPESRIILSQITTYLACSAKSNAAYTAIGKAQKIVKQTGNLPVPLHLRNAPTRLMEEIGYGSNYLYAHDHPGNFAFQEFLPEKISGTKLFDPGDNAREKEMRARLKGLWKNKYGY